MLGKSISGLASLKVETRRKLPVLERENGLDHAGDYPPLRRDVQYWFLPNRWRNNLNAAVKVRNALVKAVISMGSPTGVPEPWAST